MFPYLKAAEGMTILEAAQRADIFIPTLCHHEKLEPYGACRICTVEVEVRGWTKLVAACLYPVEKDLIVRTRSEKVDKIRKMILEFLLAHAPCSPQLQDLAEEYGADRDRFEKESSFCILCGLCVRYCAEVKKKNAVGFVDCGARREIRFIPEIAVTECIDCKECFELCPTSYLQAAFVLTESLASSTDSSPTTIDIFFFRDLYFPTMVRGLNRHKKAHLAFTAEKDTLIFISHIGGKHVF